MTDDRENGKAWLEEFISSSLRDRINEDSHNYGKKSSFMSRVAFTDCKFWAVAQKLGPLVFELVYIGQNVTTQEED